MSEGLAWLREITTTTIAAAVVGMTLLLLWTTFRAAPDFANKKDVMLYGLTILGTVVGYYFGRVPAERRAEASENKATEAQNTATRATEAAAQAQGEASQTNREKEEGAKKLAEAKAGIDKAKAALRGTQGGQPGGQPGDPRRKTLSELPASGVTPDPNLEALMELEVLSRRL